MREQIRIRGRKIVRTPPLFPGYAFVLVISAWWSARWSPGVCGLIMDGERPAVVSDQIIGEIRSRERNGLVELVKPPRGGRFRRGQKRRWLKAAVS